MKLIVDDEIILKTVQLEDVENRYKVIEENRKFLKRWLEWFDFFQSMMYHKRKRGCGYGKSGKTEAVDRGKQSHRLFRRCGSQHRVMYVSPPYRYQFTRGLIPVTLVPST